MTTNIQTREIEYTAADGTRLIGYFAAPSTATPVAGILVAPEWWGRNAYTEQRARELAEHGYAALAIDMYGDKKVTSSAAQANEWMMQTFQAPDTIVTRASAALAALAAQNEVNADKLAAIGFCYAGNDKNDTCVSFEHKGDNTLRTKYKYCSAPNFNSEDMEAEVLKRLNRVHTSRKYVVAQSSVSRVKVVYNSINREDLIIVTGKQIGRAHV